MMDDDGTRTMERNYLLPCTCFVWTFLVGHPAIPLPSPSPSLRSRGEGGGGGGGGRALNLSRPAPAAAVPLHTMDGRSIDKVVKIDDVERKLTQYDMEVGVSV